MFDTCFGMMKGAIQDRRIVSIDAEAVVEGTKQRMHWVHCMDRGVELLDTYMRAHSIHFGLLGR